MKITPNQRRDVIEIFYDAAQKDVWGIRKIEEIIKDGVYVNTNKSLTMTKEQLIDLIEEAKYFIKDK